MSKRHDSPLGKVPESWTLVHLKDVAEKVKSGATPRGGDSRYLPSRDRFALIRSQNVFDRRFDETGLAFISDKQAGELAGAEVQPGDALLNITGDGVTFARSTLVPERVLPACVNQHVMLIRPRRDKCHSGFLLSYLTHPLIKDYIESFNAGGSRRAITKGHIESFVIPLPSLGEQRAIASVLGALDDKIELNRRMNETLEAMARAIFQNWFVDATQTGLPKGWCESTLGDLVELRVDRVEATPEKDSLRYIALEDMPPKSIDVSSYQPGSAVNSSIIAFQKGDVLFGSMRPYFHKVGLAFFDGITRTTTFVLRPKHERLRHFSLFHFFSNEVVEFATTASVGTTIPYVRWDALERYEIALPPESRLEAFEKAVAPLVQRIAANGAESRTLAALRDALLPRLLSGELRVPAAAKLVEAKI